MVVVNFRGKEYRTDGQHLWEDDVLMEGVDITSKVSTISQIEAVMVDGAIYYEGKWYR